ncbi:uncharacterized protein LOC123909287 [Trifolium pratense]|uniref:uncharacterized protein LOC123909287 n=1 Tax=Trifolium pratense TaxID=57577 RepID=UPI001E6940DA|nr:uncharacterized protein LOC123909287 [Trifolium pratense]
MTAESPRKDCQSQDLLLTQWFLNACMFYYGNMPRNQGNQFISKHINIIDPLRVDNNLGRSISKASFYRIRSAFRLGAERMVRLLNCTDEYLIAEFDFFFKNTWDRHGNGYWIHVSIYNLYIRKVGKLPCQESEDEPDCQEPDNQLKESNQSSDARVVSQTQTSSPESAPIYSEAQDQHCNVFVSETESELVHFSSSMSDSKMGSSSRSEVLDNLSFGPTSCDLRSEDAFKSTNPSNMGLHKEEPDCATITESSRTLHALMDHSVDKEEHGGVGNMTESSRSYLEAVKGAKSNSNEAMGQQEEEHHFVSTAENCKNLNYLDALLGMKKSHASFSPPPSQQKKSYSLDKVQFPELKPPSPTVKRSINVGKDSVDSPSVVIKHGNVMNPAESCKYKPVSDSTSETNLSSLPSETTQPENAHDQSTVSTDIVGDESTTSESVALNAHAPFQVQQAQFPELKPLFPTVKRSINEGKDSVDPPAVMNPAESCIYTPASDSTSEINLSSLPPETTQPENVHGQSTVSTDNVRHESTTSESVALNVHALQSPCASGSSVLQFPFKFDDISHDEASNYLLNQCFDILYGDFESYWVNLKYGHHCVNGHSEEPVYFPPTVELPMDFQAPYYWNTRPSSSVNRVPVVVPGMPPTFAPDSHIEGINQGVSFWLPGSSGTGTFMPNPLTYHQRHYVEEFDNEHQNANNISERQEDSNFNSRRRSSRRGQNDYRRNEISEGKDEAPLQGEDEGSSSAVKKEAPDEGDSEGSSTAVNELDNLDKDSKDDSPHRP